VRVRRVCVRVCSCVGVSGTDRRVSPDLALASAIHRVQRDTEAPQQQTAQLVHHDAMDASQRPRHGRAESVAMMSGSSWLPPFGSHLQQMLNEAIPTVAPLSFVPVDWVQTTFPTIEPVKGGKLGQSLAQIASACASM
jgi:hypothetical protein